MSETAPLPAPRRILMLGATGTIGQATARALLARGHEVVCLLRPRGTRRQARLPDGAVLRYGDVTDPQSLARDGFCGERFDALVSCLASRTGVPRDAWAIDHAAHSHALAAARAAGVTQVVLLSAICVQRPLLAFQQAKLAFEEELMRSRLAWSIVRPTAFFKSLSGQVKRVQEGRPFLVFGDGTLTACKPISDDDLGRYMALCLEDPALRNRILPIGGPGPALTPRAQAEMLFRLMGRPPKIRQVPVALLDAIIAVLSLGGLLLPSLRDKAELARIGRYYATESMLVLDPATGRYDAEATPSFGTETLEDFYRQLLAGEATVDLGEHAVFRERAVTAEGSPGNR
ncbi:divinylchlorophyllide 8-vinylreductase [[Luteovulum] sphaeroides subsp. megalophilum]|uniref:NAD(P)H-binding protein n=1 Tax=Cereibacter sphaeroides TaxID=1063 RepID=UPI000B768B43|nr:NAD(P)H-binding protein [Cereibacter sphaeroides]SNS94454.1 divinylchlorophyllide 8-vinylreductase [[Luteovulum] sphaeroides subsp. megalophilum]